MVKFKKRRSLSNKQLESILNQIQRQLEQEQQERQQLRILLETIEQQQSQLLEHLKPQIKVSSPDELIQVPSLAQKPVISSLDYTTLEELLAAKQWQQADHETARIMLMMSGKEDKGYLNEADLHKFSCADLTKIDQLWLEASNERFGLSVQKQMYQNLGGTKFFEQRIWQSFGAQVGWYVNNSWLNYEQLNFSEQAPIGHLPVMGDSQVWFVSGWEGSHRSFSALLSRLASCQKYSNSHTGEVQQLSVLGNGE